MAFYANKVNGTSFSGEHLTSALDYLTITVDASILQLGQVSNDGTGDAASQARLDRLVEIIAINGQPIIMGLPVKTNGSSVWTLKVAIEHTGAWTSAALVSAITTHQFTGMGFVSPTVSVATTL